MDKRGLVKFVEKVKPRYEDISSERRLWMAVMLRAVCDIVQCKKTTDVTRAYAWFTSYTVTEGSFLWVCNTLGLNSRYYRDNVTEIYLRRVSGEKFKSTRGRRFRLELANGV